MCSNLQASNVAMAYTRKKSWPFILTRPLMELLSHPQSTGWSALHFSADRGDSATTEALLKAGANPHLKDKVLYSSINLCCCGILFLSHSHSLWALVKNGLTALKIAQVKVTKTVAPDCGSYPADEEQPCYEAVLSLLREHIGEGSTTLSSHHVSVQNEIICQR